MKVSQLIEALQKMPAMAVVLFEGDAGYSLVGAIDLQRNDNGMPDEVILYPDLSGD